MSKPIRFNAFEMNCVGHQSPGLWAHPRDRSWQYKDLNYWTDLAKTLEKGIFDAIFIADVVGYYDVYKGSNHHALHQGVQIPVNDPLQLAAPIAMVTEHLGIGITASTSFEHPYTFARRLSTADHHTKGRLGWNIVTSYLESGAKNVGEGGLRRHDNRYEVAAEYTEVLYKLFEGSWEEGAVVRDKERGVFARPDKVHEIGHKGKYFEVPGYHLCEPSPQRTPVLFQAGASGAGKTFAAQHAECVFVATPSRATLKDYVADVRAQAAAAGRDPAKVLVYTLVTVIVDETDDKARAKFEDYKRHVSYDGALVLMSGWSGIDFGQYAPADPDVTLSRSLANCQCTYNSPSPMMAEFLLWKMPRTTNSQLPGCVVPLSGITSPTFQPNRAASFHPMRHPPRSLRNARRSLSFRRISG